VVDASPAINASLYDKLNFSFIRDIAPVASLVNTPLVMTVTPSFPAKTVPEFIAYAKANPGKINMASAGNGNPTHVSGELFKMMTGIDMVHVPYRGTGPALTDLLGGQVQVMFGGSLASVEHIRAGRLRALAVSMRKGSPSVPGIPGTEEAGLPEYEFTFWFGLYVPAGTPGQVIRRLHEAAVSGLAKPEVRDKIAIQGMDPTPSASPEAFEADIRSEAPALERMIRESGARVE